jgi:hypothetical protein
LEVVRTDIARIAAVLGVFSLTLGENVVLVLWAGVWGRAPILELGPKWYVRYVPAC